jgi:hypothetical protein
MRRRRLNRLNRPQSRRRGRTKHVPKSSFVVRREQKVLYKSGVFGKKTSKKVT